MHIRILTILLLLARLGGNCQPDNDLRSRLTIMVVPYVSGSQDIEGRLERDSGYKNAISSINSALINMGYTKTVDFRMRRDNKDGKHFMLNGRPSTGRMEINIENAPVDVLIETEITWIDTPGNPRDRRAKLHLKAIDAYTNAVYADNSSIQSAQREFPDVSTAVEAALERDGRAQFRTFLTQLDTSYSKLLRNGRQVNIQFDLGKETAEKFSDLAGDERLADRIEGFIRQQAFHGQYELAGETGTYMQFSVYVPIVDEDGMSQTPGWFLRRTLDSYFRQWGYAVDYATMRNWLNFTLQKKIGTVK